MTTVSVTMATTLNLILTFSVIIGNAFVVSPDLKRHIVPQALSSLLSSSSSSPSSSLLSSVSEAESIAMDTPSATGRILLPSTDPTRFDFGCVANPVVRIYIICLPTFIYIYVFIFWNVFFRWLDEWIPVYKNTNCLTPFWSKKNPWISFLFKSKV